MPACIAIRLPPGLDIGIDPGTDRRGALRRAADEELGMAAGQLDHYQALMLDREVDPDLMTTVYRRLVQRYHAAAAGDAAAVERLDAVERAFAVLRDPRRRARYDADLAWQEGHEAAGAEAPRAVTPPVPVPAPAPMSSTQVSRTFASATASSVRATPTTPVAVPIVSRRPISSQSVPVSVLDFGRYAGWSLRQIAARDPDYLEWLLRSPGGRQYRAEITAILQPR